MTEVFEVEDHFDRDVITELPHFPQICSICGETAQNLKKGKSGNYKCIYCHEETSSRLSGSFSSISVDSIIQAVEKDAILELHTLLSHVIDSSLLNIVAAPSLRTPLHHAVLSEHPIELTRLLLRAGADPLIPDHLDGSTPLGVAFTRPHPQLHALMLTATGPEGISHVDKSGRSPLHWAAHLGCLSSVGLLLNIGADPAAEDTEGRNALHRACDSPHPDVDLVADRIVRVRRELLRVPTSCHMAMVPHALATAAGRGDVLRALGPEGLVDTDASGCSAVHYAAGCCDDLTMGWIMDAAPGLLTAVGGGGATPLHYAAKAGNTRASLVLLGRGASLTDTDSHGRRPDQVAGLNNHAGLAARLRGLAPWPVCIRSHRVMPIAAAISWMLLPLAVGGEMALPVVSLLLLAVLACRRAPPTPSTRSGALPPGCAVCGTSDLSQGVVHCPRHNRCVDGFDHCCLWLGVDIGAHNRRSFFLVCLIGSVLNLWAGLCLAWRTWGEPDFAVAPSSSVVLLLLRVTRACPLRLPFVLVLLAGGVLAMCVLFHQSRLVSMGATDWQLRTGAAGARDDGVCENWKRFWWRVRK